jgi:hypothetical protein
MLNDLNRVDFGNVQEQARDKFQKHFTLVNYKCRQTGHTVAKQSSWSKFKVAGATLVAKYALA